MRFTSVLCDTRHTALYGIGKNICNILSEEKTGWKIMCMCAFTQIHLYDSKLHIKILERRVPKGQLWLASSKLQDYSDLVSFSVCF